MSELEGMRELLELAEYYTFFPTVNGEANDVTIRKRVRDPRLKNVGLSLSRGLEQ